MVLQENGNNSETNKTVSGDNENGNKNYFEFEAVDDLPDLKQNDAELECENGSNKLKLEENNVIKPQIN